MSSNPSDIGWDRPEDFYRSALNELLNTVEQHADNPEWLRTVCKSTREATAYGPVVRRKPKAVVPPPHGVPLKY